MNPQNSFHCKIWKRYQLPNICQVWLLNNSYVTLLTGANFIITVIFLYTVKMLLAVNPLSIFLNYWYLPNHPNVSKCRQLTNVCKLHFFNNHTCVNCQNAFNFHCYLSRSKVMLIFKIQPIVRVLSYVELCQLYKYCKLFNCAKNL